MSVDSDISRIISTVDALPTPVCVSADSILHANRALEELLGRANSELRGLRLVPDIFRDSIESSPALAGWHSCQTESGLAVEVSLQRLPASPIRIVAMRLAEGKHVLVRALEAIDDERRRVARELHDETGQWLTTLIVGLQTAETRATNSDVVSELARLRQVTQTTVNELRRLCRGLHPGTLEKLGLFAGLGSLLDDFSTTHRVATHLDLAALRDMPRLAPKTELAIFRLVQEALTNAARHAKPSSVSLQASRAKGNIIIEVIDDGTGFERSRVRPTSLGLRGMRERAENIGGTLEIRTSEGSGTTIRLVIPSETSRQQPTLRLP